MSVWTTTNLWPGVIQWAGKVEEEEDMMLEGAGCCGADISKVVV